MRTSSIFNENTMAFALSFLTAIVALAAYGLLTPLAAFAQNGDDHKWNDQHYSSHSYNSDTRSYSDNNGNDYKCQYVHEDGYYYYFDGNYYKCDDYSGNNNDDHPYYYDQHYSSHSYKSDSNSYGDDSGNDYKCGQYDDGNYYYKYNGDWYKCDDYSNNNNDNNGYSGNNNGGGY